MESSDIMAKIRKLQVERGWSESDLAKYSDVPQSTISSLFKRNNLPTVTTLESICKSFGITLSQFFNEYDSIVGLSEEQKFLLTKWDLLKDEKREAIIHLLKII